MNEKQNTDLNVVSGRDRKAEPLQPWLSDASARRLDDLLTSAAGRTSGGLPAPRIALAFADWLINLAASPGRQLQILEKLLRSRYRLVASLLGDVPPISDSRYSTEAWKRKPFVWLAHGALAREELIRLATDPLPGMDRHNAELVRFYSQQLAEALSPANFPLTNPEVLKATRQQRGKNLLRGLKFGAGDLWRKMRRKADAPSGTFRVGANLAATPGKVVHRNDLMELIQYAPTTETVHAEPVLIVPAWIMKYYILDLSERNSLVRWLVGQGHTVFMVSWKNPVAEDRDLSMDDYRRLGVLEALNAINAIVPAKKIHAVGYCVGGTLLSIAAAALARDGDERIQSVTLFAAQTDFTDAGELKLFVDEMALHWLDRLMKGRGYLDSSQMGAAFSLLRPRDLIWTPMIRRYFLGESSDAFDIMAWNADGTRMPHRMHSDYLRQLYLENQLAEGKYQVGQQTVSIGDIQVPLFVVGTTTDHVAPWKSVYKIRNLKKLGDTTFVLTTGGHNAGIVSEPGRARRKFQLGSWDQSTPYLSPEEWAATAQTVEGSWWPAWQAWLTDHSSDRVLPPAMGRHDKKVSVLGNAPGTYVLQR